MHSILIAVCITLTILSHSVISSELITGCGSRSYPPISYLEQSAPADEMQPLKGVGIDALKRIFSEQGKSVEIYYVGSWKRCQLLVQQGKFDILVGAYVNKQRTAHYDYPFHAIMDESQSIFVSSERQFNFNHWDDLIGKRASVATGYSAGQKFDEFLHQHTKLFHLKDDKKIFQLLLKGRIDFQVNGYHAGIISIKKNNLDGQIVALPHPVNTAKIYTPFSKKSAQLKELKTVNEGLYYLKKQGVIKQLIEKHIEKLSK